VPILALVVLGVLTCIMSAVLFMAVVLTLPEDGSVALNIAAISLSVVSVMLLLFLAVLSVMAAFQSFGNVPILHP